MAKGANRISPFFSLILRNWEAKIGMGIASLFVLTAIVVEVANVLGIQVTPYNPLQQGTGPALAPPSLSHILGTDLIGRDFFSRIIAATPTDMSVGATVVAIAFTVGILVGTLAAFKGGLVDELLMRFTDVIFALPAMIIAMVIAVALGPGVINMIIALTVVWWPPYARLARGEALKVSHENYIEAARMSGSGTWKIISRHLIPNTFTTMLIYATLDFGTVLLVYAGLSYLGLSIRPPAPDWGEMVSSYQDYLVSSPWLPLAPGITIAIAVTGFSLLGDGIRDALEVR